MPGSPRYVGIKRSSVRALASSNGITNGSSSRSTPLCVGASNKSGNTSLITTSLTIRCTIGIIRASVAHTARSRFNWASRIDPVDGVGARNASAGCTRRHNRLLLRLREKRCLQTTQRESETAKVKNGNYTREPGFGALSTEDESQLRRYGIYTQRPVSDGFFMVRIRIPGGELTPVQLRTIAELSSEHGRGLADVTVRQNIQLHWVRNETLPEIF